VKLPFDVRALWESALRWYRGHSVRDQRIILTVIVAAVLSLVYVGVVEPVLDYRKGVAQEISDKQEELERSLRFLAAKDTLRAERDELRKKLAQAKSRLLPGGTGTLGAAALQERANAIATEKGITPQSTQVMKEETVEPFHKVSVRLTLSGELRPLAEFVSGLEYGQQLTVPFIEIARRGAVAGAKGPRTLSVTLEVSGFVQSGGKGKGEASEAEVAAAAVAPAPDGSDASATASDNGAAAAASSPTASDNDAAAAASSAAEVAAESTSTTGAPAHDASSTSTTTTGASTTTATVASRTTTTGAMVTPTTRATLPPPRTPPMSPPTGPAGVVPSQQQPLVVPSTLPAAPPPPPPPATVPPPPAAGPPPPPAPPAFTPGVPPQAPPPGENDENDYDDDGGED
jgi:Tfp pilus assembly protein PilO